MVNFPPLEAMHKQEKLSSDDVTLRIGGGCTPEAPQQGSYSNPNRSRNRSLMGCILNSSKMDNEQILLRCEVVSHGYMILTPLRSPLTIFTVFAYRRGSFVPSFVHGICFTRLASHPSLRVS